MVQPVTDPKVSVSTYRECDDSFENDSKNWDVTDDIQIDVDTYTFKKKTTIVEDITIIVKVNGWIKRDT